MYLGFINEVELFYKLAQELSEKEEISSQLDEYYLEKEESEEKENKKKKIVENLPNIPRDIALLYRFNFKDNFKDIKNNIWLENYYNNSWLENFYNSLPPELQTFEAQKAIVSVGVIRIAYALKNVMLRGIKFEEFKYALKLYGKEFIRELVNSSLVTPFFYAILCANNNIPFKKFFISEDIDWTVGESILDGSGNIIIGGTIITISEFGELVKESKTAEEFRYNIHLRSELSPLKKEEFVQAGLSQFLKKDIYPTLNELLILAKNNSEVVNFLQKLKNKFDINESKKVLKDAVKSFKILIFSSTEIQNFAFLMRFFSNLLDIYGLEAGKKAVKLINVFDIVHNLDNNSLVSSISFIDHNRHLYKFDFNSNDAKSVISGVFLLQKYDKKLTDKLLEYKLGTEEDVQNLINNFNQGKFTQQDVKIAKAIQTVQSMSGARNYLRQAKQNKKDPKITSIHLDLGNGLEFKALPDMDLNHFTVGLDTDCCQRIGGAGEAAAIDSFINPLAGVLILYSKGQIAAQSYFHYIPQNNSYILDNVESNKRVVKSHNLNLSEAYSRLAQHLLKQGFTQVLAGKDYSALNTNDFQTIKLEEDLRSFEVYDPYTDFDENDAMNLGALEKEDHKNKQKSQKPQRLQYRLEEKFKNPA